MKLFRQIAVGLQQLFYPQLCPGCGTLLQSGEKVICLACVAHLPFTNFHYNPHNLVASVFAGRLPLEKATSFLFFNKEGLTQQLLHQLKYKGRQDIGVFLGGLFARELNNEQFLNDIDLILPVPLHPRKQFKRGFNQSAAVAKGMSEASGIAYATNAVAKIKHTESQTHKTRSQRIENVAGVFKVNNAALLQNRHLLLVDDVLTTGATLESCALELLKIAGVRLSVATLSIAVD
ncbi:MAG: ComF family protein [Edaphocola sp.]